MEASTVIVGIDKLLETTGQISVNPVEANAALDKMSILNDRGPRPGLPLRRMLREGLLLHAYQLGGPGTEWVLPHSPLR